jgi:DNA-binding response OmpR family regulator
MKKILVIDDERDVLEIVRTVLKSKGYHIRCVEGGAEGLKSAETDRPDLIICDLMMPRMSGMEVVKRLKAHPELNGVPVFILSAVASDKSRPDDYWARGLGVDEFISKPFDPLDLLGRVEYIFRRQGYVSSRVFEDNGAPLTPGSESFAPKTPGGGNLASQIKEMSPYDLAKTFVECWNSQDWSLEYQCMADELTSAISVNDYIARRHQAFSEDRGKVRAYKLGDVIEERVSGNVAKVVAEREDQMENRSFMRKATYTLKKTYKGWKILKYTDEPLRRPTELEEEV